MKRIRTKKSNRFEVIGLSALLILAGSNLLAEEADKENTENRQWSDVRVFDVAPFNRAAAVLTPNAQTPPPPAPLDDEDRKAALANIVEAPDGNTDSDDSVESASFEATVLSAAQMSKEGSGVLTLVRPYTVHPETGIHMRGSDEGSVGVKVKVEQGAKYLLDFQVKSAVPGVYVVRVDGVEHEVSDADGKREHVLLVLRAASSGWTTVRLNRPETDFMLYAVELRQEN